MKRRNKTITCVRPTHSYYGDLIFGNATPGIEPPFSNNYIRKIKNEETNKEGSTKPKDSNRNNP